MIGRAFTCSQDQHYRRPGVATTFIGAFKASDSGSRGSPSYCVVTAPARSGGRTAPTARAVALGMHAAPRDEGGDATASLLPLACPGGAFSVPSRTSQPLASAVFLCMHSDVFLSLVQFEDGRPPAARLPDADLPSNRGSEPSRCLPRFLGASPPSALFRAAGCGRSDRLRLQLRHKSCRSASSDRVRSMGLSVERGCRRLPRSPSRP